jgi:hypothetical protein
MGEAPQEKMKRLASEGDMRRKHLYRETIRMSYNKSRVYWQPWYQCIVRFSPPLLGQVCLLRVLYINRYLQATLSRESTARIYGSMVT